MAFQMPDSPAYNPLPLQAWPGKGFFVSLVLFAISRSKRLSDFLEDLSDEKLGFTGKLKAFWNALAGKER